MTESSSEGKRWEEMWREQRNRAQELAPEIERLREEIRGEHAIKALQSGSPCVCEICREDAA